MIHRRLPAKGNAFLVHRVTPVKRGQKMFDRLEVHEIPLGDAMEIEMLQRLARMNGRVKRRELEGRKRDEGKRLEMLVSKKPNIEQVFVTYAPPGTYKKHQIVDEFPHIKERDYR